MATTIEKKTEENGEKRSGNRNLDELVEKAKQGDAHSFGVIYEDQYPKIFSFIWKYHPQYKREDIEDFVQETFLRAYKNICNLKENKYFVTWLHDIAKNMLIDDLKKTERRSKLIALFYTPLYCYNKDEVDENREKTPILCHNNNPENAIREKEFEGLLNKLIEDIPKILRDVLKLRVFDGLSYEEISRIENASFNTVRLRLYSAKIALIGIYKGYMVENGVLLPSLESFRTKSGNLTPTNQPKS